MNKVNYYYNCLMEYANFLFPDKNIKSLSSNKTPIKKILLEIIENNNDYLLTKSYMYYLILDSMCVYKNIFYDNFRDNLYQLLVNITLGEKHLIRDLIHYINIIENGYNLYFRFSETETKRVRYLLDKDINKILNDYHNSILRLEVNSHFENEDYRIVINSFKIICAICIINKNYDEYNSIVETIFNDLDSFLDRIKLNGEFIIFQEVNLNKLIMSVKCVLNNKKILIK